MKQLQHLPLLSATKRDEAFNRKETKTLALRDFDVQEANLLLVLRDSYYKLELHGIMYH